MSTESRYAVSNDDLNRAIMLTWRTPNVSVLTLMPDDARALERLVGEMARAVRSEPERIDAAVAAERARGEASHAELAAEAVQLRAQVAAQREAIAALQAAEGYEARQRVFRAALTAADLVQRCVAEAAPGVPNVGRGLLSKLAEDLNAAGFKVPTW